MRELPILFSTMMVQANLEDRKGMTRRLIGLGFINESFPEDWEYLGVDSLGHLMRNVHGATNAIKCPYGKPGDLLWVRESFRVNSWVPDDGELTFRYEADGAMSPYICLDDEDAFNRYWEQSCSDLADAGYVITEDERYQDYEYQHLRLRPNIHLPKVAARIWLQVTDVRVERLQDISEEDAKAEGIKSAGCEDHFSCPSKLCINECVDKDNWWNYLAPNGEDFPCFTAKESFESLWRSINGADSWQANPWVWVIQYKVLSKTGKPDLSTLKAIA